MHPPSPIVRAVVVPLLILTLLIAQGLRLCISIDPAHNADGQHAPIHLESSFTLLADGHEPETGSDVDLPLPALAKLLKLLLVCVVALAFVLLLPVVPFRHLRIPSPTVPLSLLRGYGLFPPARAPPR